MATQKLRHGQMVKKPARNHRMDKPQSKLYRVHNGAGETLVIEDVTAVDLTWEQANKFKQVAVSRYKERKASIEATGPNPDFEQSELPPAAVATGNLDEPNPDPDLEAFRQKAIAAARPAAAAAQLRANAAKTVNGMTIPVHAGKPVNGKQASPGFEKPTHKVAIVGLDDVDAETDNTTPNEDGDAPLGDKDLADLVAGGDLPGGVDLAHAQKTAAEELAEQVAKGKALYKAVRGHLPNFVPFEKLSKADQAVWRFNAQNPQPDAAALAGAADMDVACATLKPGNIVTYFPGGPSDEEPELLKSELAVVLEVHTPRMISIQLGIEPDGIAMEDGRPVYAAEPTGKVLKSVGRRVLDDTDQPGTWSLASG